MPRKVPNPAQPVAAPPFAPPRVQTNAPAASHASRSSGLSIPILSGHLLLDFGRLDSTHRIHNLRISIANQETIASYTYQQMEQLSAVALVIEMNDFIRLWKTLILKRVQDVYKQEKHRRAPDFIRLMRNLPIPAPLADLLYCLGQKRSSAVGTILDMVLPPKVTPASDWWTLDETILDHWCLTNSRMSTLYQIKEFPAPSEFQDRTIGFTAIQDVGELRFVKSHTNEPSVTDGFIRFVNDDLFQNPYLYVTCDLRIVEALERHSIAGNYVGSYELQTNS